MKLTDQVCTLEQSKKLKELGIIQKSIWYWCPCTTRPTGEVTHYVLASPLGADTGNFIAGESEKYPMYSAFTGSELRVMLPEFITIENRAVANQKYRIKELFYSSSKEVYKRKHACFYQNEDDNDDMIELLDTFSTEAQSRAALLIHILEHSPAIAKVEDCNKWITE